MPRIQSSAADQRTVSQAEEGLVSERDEFRTRTAHRAGRRRPPSPPADSQGSTPARWRRETTRVTSDARGETHRGPIQRAAAPPRRPLEAPRASCVKRQLGQGNKGRGGSLRCAAAARRESSRRSFGVACPAAGSSPRVCTRPLSSVSMSRRSPLFNRGESSGRRAGVPVSRQRRSKSSVGRGTAVADLGSELFIWFMPTCLRSARERS